MSGDLPGGAALCCGMVPTQALPEPPDAWLAPVVLDMEASGFGRDSYPIEVGFAMPDGRLYCSLIRPVTGWTHWDPAAEALHHISRVNLLRHGRDPTTVCQQLNHQLHGMTVYSDGWANDYSWLGKLYDAAGRVPSFRLDNLRGLLSERQADHWHATKQQVANELHSKRHRASADAQVLQLTLRRLHQACT